MAKNLTVTNSQDNANGTTTNTLSDGSTDTGLLVANSDGSRDFHTISSSSLAPSSSFNLTAPAPSTETDGVLGTISANTDAFTRNLQETAKQREQASKDSLAAYMKGVLQTPGQSTLTDQAYSQAVDPAEADLKDINQQLLAEQHGLDRRLQALDQNKQGFFGTGLQQEKQRIQDESLRRQADLSIIQLAKQGKYDSAKAIADRAVSAQLERNKNEIDALKLNYEDNKSLFNTAEQQSFESQLADRKNAYELQAYHDKAYFDQQIKQNDPQYQEDLRTKQYENSFLNPGGASDPVSAASNAILGNESNGSYTATSPVLPSGSAKGQRSYGKYQVLESNIPSWTKQYYGQSLTPQQFLQNPAAQEAVQKGKISDLWNQYGNIKDVASVYFTGVPYAQAVAEGRKDQATGMTVQDYAAKAEARFQQASAPAQGGNSVVDSYVKGIQANTVKLSDVPKALQPAVVQALATSGSGADSKQLKVINDIDNALANPAFKYTFGFGNALDRNLPGQPQYALKSEIQQITAQLALAARGQLKGQGQVSDFEGRLLQNAQTSLRFNMKPEEARYELMQVRGAIRTSSGLPATVKITAPDGSTGVVEATQDGINQAIADGARVEYQ